jgi:putative FmdB family regulatory protein
MPTYVYQCKECGIQFERVQHFSEAQVTNCPECNGAVHRVICPVGVIFKGSGWYVKDSAKAKSSTLPKRGAEEKEGDAGAKAPASADTPAKPAPKETAKSATAAD